MEAAFADLSFFIEPGLVFSPRPATESVVRAALAAIGDEPSVAADAGSGSGVIAVTLAVRRPNLRVYATDISPAAVALTRANAERHGVSDRVHALEGDLLEPVPEPVDFITANLPYLPEALRDPRYDTEPAEAIYAPGDGLDPYRRLLGACREGRLKTGGLVAIQLHREALTANCWQLEDLREQIERLNKLAA